MAERRDLMKKKFEVPYDESGVKVILLAWMRRLAEDDGFVSILNSRNVGFLLETLSEESRKLYDQRTNYNKELEHVRNLSELEYDE